MHTKRESGAAIWLLKGEGGSIPSWTFVSFLLLCLRSFVFLPLIGISQLDLHPGAARWLWRYLFWYAFIIAKLMYQFIRIKLPSCYSNYFTCSSDSYSTANSFKNDLHLPHFSTARTQQSLKHVAAKL